jgi:polyphosphate kinase
LSETIRVHSVLGRFLEHSRILYFQNGGDERFYIGSADMMPRNLDGRVETLVTVANPSIQEELRAILDVGFEANVHAWVLGADGRWATRPVSDDELAIDLQAELVARSSGGS